jgi:ABC-type sugar transport system ATPase subunit
MVQIEAMTPADRIVVMNHGRIEQVGKPLELYYAPADLFVAGFIGFPAMNFFPAEVESIEDGTARIAGDSVAPFGLPAGPLKPGAAVTIGVRPEHLTPPAEGDFMTAGVVELVERLGEASYAHVRRADEKMTAAEIRGRRTSLPANVCNCPRPSRIFTCPMRRVAGLRRRLRASDRAPPPSRGDKELSSGRSHALNSFFRPRNWTFQPKDYGP